jgi:hypothetical protein
MSIHGEWETALIDINATEDATEFTGFDADRYSNVVDLGREYDKVHVICPAVDSSTIAVYPIPEDGTAIKTNIPLPVYALDSDATGSFLHATTAGTATCTAIFDIYGFRYVRVKAGADQTEDRTFYLKGIKL